MQKGAYYQETTVPIYAKCIRNGSLMSRQLILPFSVYLGSHKLESSLICSPCANSSLLQNFDGLEEGVFVISSRGLFLTFYTFGCLQ